MQLPKLGALISTQVKIIENSKKVLYPKLATTDQFFKQLNGCRAERCIMGDFLPHFPINGLPPE